MESFYLNIDSVAICQIKEIKSYFHSGFGEKLDPIPPEN